MPDWKAKVRERLGNSRIKGTREAGLIEELSQHLEDRYQELRSEGASEAEAYQGALAELNDTELLDAHLQRSDRIPAHDPVPHGAAGTGSFFGDAFRDMRYALRSFRKNPTFTFFVIVTLALGIGANTTVFTIVNTLILNPLPVQKPSELVVLSRSEAKDARSRGTLPPISYPDLEDLQNHTAAFSKLAGYTFVRTLTWANGATPERLFGEFVTGNYFDTLGLTPVKGRFFLPEEANTPGGHPVAVMNYASWQARFGGASDIVGRVLRINNVVVTVIGIAPPRFIGVNAVFGPDLWIPSAMAEQVSPGEFRNMLRDRKQMPFYGVARLKPGVSRQEADANVQTVAADLQKEYPETNEGQSFAVRPLSDALFGDTGSSGNMVVFGSAVLLVVVGLVLLIACSNVANMLLARSAARKQEIAVRLAIGASRRRLIRQMLTESVLLGLLSGIVGMAIGYEGCQIIWSFRPPEVAANLIGLKLDTTVLLYTAIVSFITGVIFGIVPAIRGSRADVVEALKEETRSAGRSRSSITFGNALLVAQVAFSFLSLVIAALFLRSIQHDYQMDPGFETKKLAVFMTNAGQAGYTQAQAKEFYRQVGDRVETLPGVASVSWASNLPMWGRVASGLLIEGREKHKSSDTITTVLNTVDVNYFATAGVPMKAGRAFVEGDRQGSLPVTIINDTMARQYWPNQSALGKRIQAPGENFYRQIIGIAKTANYQSIGEAPQPCVYLPLQQNLSTAMTLYVRTKGDPEQMLTTIQREIRAVGPQIEVSDIRTGTKIINQALGMMKMMVALLGIFGLIALGLASVGLYGIMAYSVTRRTREIGVRIALGAERMSVLRLVLRQGMTLVTVGLAIGLGAALLIGRVLSRRLYGMGASDPIGMAGAAAVLLAVALIACYLPARGASRVDPIVALREG